MQVSIEKISELSRKMTVSIPKDVIQEKMENRFKSLARKVKIDGFRPGKVPIRVVKKIYSEQVKAEITEDLIQSTYFDALKKQDLNPAGHPHIHLTDEVLGFRYTAEFEVYPKISLGDLSKLEIKNPVTTIQQSDVDAMIARLREQEKKWRVVERNATKGDQVTLHFSGICEGEYFTDGKVENYTIEIGSERIIPGLDDKLIGLSAGSNKTFNITFPEQYNNQELVGKTVEFEIELLKVEEAVLPEIDATFIKNYGVEDGTVASFNAYIRTNMERNLVWGLRQKLKDGVMDALYQAIKITVPNTLIEQHLKTMVESYQKTLKKDDIDLDGIDLEKILEDKAKYETTISLILNEIIEKNAITVDEIQVRTTLKDIAKNYHSPADIIDWYYADETRLDEIKQLVLEQQIVAWIVKQAKVSDELVNYEDVVVAVIK